MSQKTKRISINSLEKAVKAQEEFITREWNGISITIRPTLPLKEMLGFVNDVFLACFLEDGEFCPEIFDFAVKQGVMTRYANFTMPDNVEKQYLLVCSTNVVEEILKCVNQVQFNEMLSAVHRKIENKRELGKGKRLEEIYETVEGLLSYFSENFANVGEADLQKMLEVLQSHKEQEGTVEERVVSAYRNEMEDGIEQRLEQVAEKYPKVAEMLAITLAKGMEHSEIPEDDTVEEVVEDAVEEATSDD